MSRRTLEEVQIARSQLLWGLEDESRRLERLRSLLLMMTEEDRSLVLADGVRRAGSEVERSAKELLSLVRDTA